MSDGLHTAPEIHLPNQQDADVSDITKPQISDVHIAALDYCQRGWYILPLHNPTQDGCSCYRGSACTAVGKHPRTKNGLIDASNDSAQIKEWWTRWPDANIGVLTGSKSGLLVLDLDNKDGKDGSKSFDELSTAIGCIPATLTASTGNGEHLFFKDPGKTVKNSVSKLAQGVDVRTDGAYVVAAPSLHENGRRYTWTGQQPIAELPPALLDLLVCLENENHMHIGEPNAFSQVSIVHKGERNDALYDIGCCLRGQEAKDYEQIVSILLEYNESKCTPPLDEAEVRTIATQVCKHPAESATNKSTRRIEGSPLYWFPFNTRDWLSDVNVVLMTDYQMGWYIQLIAIAWSNGGFLPADKNKLCRLAKASSKKKFEAECNIVLVEFEEVLIDGELKFKHPRLAKLYADTIEKWMKKKQAGQASNAAKLAAFRQQQPQVA